MHRASTGTHTVFTPRPESSTSPSFPHPRTEVVALPRGMSRILHKRFHEDQGPSPNWSRQNCGFRVSPGTATSVFRKLPSNSLPGHLQQRWTCSTGGGSSAEPPFTEQWTVEIEQGMRYAASGLAEMCVVFALVQPSVLMQCIFLQVPSPDSATYVGYDNPFAFREILRDHINHSPAESSGAGQRWQGDLYP